MCANQASAYPFGYTLSWAFLRSPKTQIALSARHREHGLEPSHWSELVGSSIFNLKLDIPWISSNDTDRMLCKLSFGHCYQNANAPKRGLIAELPWRLYDILIRVERMGVFEVGGGLNPLLSYTSRCGDDRVWSTSIGVNDIMMSSQKRFQRKRTDAECRFKVFNGRLAHI